MKLKQLTKLKKMKLVFYFILCLPHYVIYVFQRKINKIKIDADIERWKSVYLPDASKLTGFVFLLCFYPEFRSLFYYRIGSISNLLNIYCRKLPTLYITTESIGGGFFIQHGFATVIAANSIGENCWVNQQVTIGYSNQDLCPTIMDNVTINAGAKVIGGVVVGAGSIVGANAVVVKNVPQKSTVVGVPAYIIKRDGKRVNEKL